MLNADMSDGVFQSKFGEGSENFQECLENSNQNSSWTLILTKLFKNYHSDGILSEILFDGILLELYRNFIGLY